MNAGSTARENIGYRDHVGAIIDKAIECNKILDELLGAKESVNVTPPDKQPVYGRTLELDNLLFNLEENMKILRNRLDQLMAKI